MAFVFGLLHGLGFAGALADIGLPKEELWLSLLLFNVGIEAGQVFVIAVLYALLGCCRVSVSRHSFINPLRGAWAVWLPFGP